MPAFFKALSVPGTAYATTPDISLGFAPDQVHIQNTGGQPLLYSFTGGGINTNTVAGIQYVSNDHGQVNSGGDLNVGELLLRTKQTSFYFRAPSGATTITVRATTDV